jgi:Tol biopolymer transport system component/DNA-binding winged helix-turn-helix (wHTH) protein
MPSPTSPRYRFGDFCLEVVERRLLRGGVDVPLPPKVFGTLLLLVENSGHLVEKDEFMRKVWPDAFVGEDALTRNISILRKTLGESSDSQTFIATVPTRGYRFLVPVEPATEVQPNIAPVPDSSSGSGVLEAGPSRKLSRSPASRLFLLFAFLAVGAFSAVVTYLFPAPVPRVIRSVQLTHSGRVDSWTNMVSDGSRIYFTERVGDHWNLVQTSVEGGDSQIVSAPFPNTVVKDISPDHTKLLIGSFDYRGALMPLWIWPIQGGAPQPVGDVRTYDAIWFPNGREILYTTDNGLDLVNVDGSNSREFLPLDGRPGLLSWSPDGRLLRFSLAKPGVLGATMWEVQADGSSLRPLLQGWDSYPGSCCGSWTPGGEYFLFQSSHSGSKDIWGIQEKARLWHRRAEPIRLTAGPTDFGYPLVGRDGRTVFVYGNNGRNEFLRYDLQSRRFFPLISGIAARTLFLSRDGQWLAYVTLDHALVLMRADGSQQRVIVPGSFEADGVCWSPDGKQIAFVGLRQNRTQAIFVVPPEGGVPREFYPQQLNQFDVSWSPDGYSIAFVSDEKASRGSSSQSIYILHIPTNQLSSVPGSQGLRSPTWSPDGRFLAAKSADEHRLMLFDSTSGKWTELARARLLFGLPLWSRDGRSLYYQDLLAPDQPVYRLHLDTNKEEVVIAFKDFLQGSAIRAALIGLAPDGSLLALLTRNDSDIYALHLELH